MRSVHGVRLTDEAFAALPTAVVDIVAGDDALLPTVLTHHVIAGKYNLDQLPKGTIKTLAGDDLTITKIDGVTYIDGNAVTVQNVQATNGVIHVASNVLVPALGDIIDVATTLPGFTTLASLVTQADMVDTLKGEGPFTVFAPADAFDALDPATLNAVLADPELLATVLTYHVIAGKLNTDQLVEGTITTVAGIDLTFTKIDRVTYIDGNPILVQNVLIALTEIPRLCSASSSGEDSPERDQCRPPRCHPHARRRAGPSRP